MDAHLSLSLLNMRKSFPIFEEEEEEKNIRLRQKILARAETARVDDRAKRETRRSLQNRAL